MPDCPNPTPDRAGELEKLLQDSKAVHLNMLRGGIAKLTPEQIGHLYRGDEARAVIAEIERQNGFLASRSSGEGEQQDPSLSLGSEMEGEYSAQSQPIPVSNDGMPAPLSDGWRVIASAPNDGSWVLLYSVKWPIWSYPMVGWRHDPGDQWEYPAHPQWADELPWPTHWMPMPSPPEVLYLSGAQRSELSRSPPDEPLPSPPMEGEG